MDPYSVNNNEIITNLIKDVSISTFDKTIGLTNSNIQILKVSFKVGFVRYIENTIKNHAFVKTLLYRDHSEFISNIYVPQFFETSGEKRNESELTQS